MLAELSSDARFERLGRRPLLDRRAEARVWLLAAFSPLSFLAFGAMRANGRVMRRVVRVDGVEALVRTGWRVASDRVITQRVLVWRRSDLFGVVGCAHAARVARSNGPGE